MAEGTQRSVGRGVRPQSVTSSPGHGSTSTESTTEAQLQQLQLQQQRLHELLHTIQQQPQPQPLSTDTTTDATPSNPSPTDAQTEVAPLSLHVKLPNFWPADPLVWFAQVESLFATRNITRQATRFHHVISSLSPEIAAEVRDIIISPPSDDPYDHLKSQLIQRTQTSEQRRLRMLLSSEDLGDQKPSQLLRRMQQLLGEHRMDDALFRELFEQRLPAHVRMVLASSASSLAIADVAAMADRIVEVAQPSQSLNAVSRPSVPDSTVIAALQEQVATLTTAVEELTKAQRRLSRSYRSRSRDRDASPAPAAKVTISDQPTEGPGLCFYHRQWGSKARKCTQPCSFSGNAPASS